MAVALSEKGDGARGVHLSQANMLITNDDRNLCCLSFSTGLKYCFSTQRQQISTCQILLQSNSQENLQSKMNLLKTNFIQMFYQRTNENYKHIKQDAYFLKCG